MVNNKNAQNAQVEKARGNTRTRAWCLTINNYEDFNLVVESAQIFEKYVIGKEVGENGTPHLQMWLYKKDKICFNKLKTLFPTAHIEPAKGNEASNVKYCTKENDYVSKGVKVRKTIRDPLFGKELHDFQKQVLEIIAGPADERTIHWFVDEKGGKGKTSLAKHICMNYAAIYLSGKSNDIKYAIANWIAEKDLDICIFDFTRSSENFISYQGLEEVKNGIFFCNKYESKQIIINPPHVVCFSNFEPDESKLSEDRWKIYKL